PRRGRARPATEHDDARRGGRRRSAGGRRSRSGGRLGGKEPPKLSEAGRAPYLTMKVPSMPSSACSPTVHSYVYLPFFLKVTVSVADLCGWISGVALLIPERITKLWASLPVFVTLNETVPGLASVLADSLKLNSKALTVTFVAAAFGAAKL